MNTYVAPGVEHGTSPSGRSRARYRWLWPLTIVNVVCLALAAIGVVVPQAARLSVLFPQIWWLLTAPGAVIGTFTVIVILICAMVNRRRGVDRKDRRYRFYGGLTLASSIMFATFFVVMAVIFVIPSWLL